MITTDLDMLLVVARLTLDQKILGLLSCTLALENRIVAEFFKESTRAISGRYFSQ